MWLTDFGAAFFYDRNAEYGKLLECIERRAFCHLLGEVKDLIDKYLKLNSAEDNNEEEIGAKIMNFSNVVQGMIDSKEESTFEQLYKQWEVFYNTNH